MLYKKGDKQLLENWRPITLVNVDYKILTHVLSIRLHKVLNNLIDNDQKGYLKGRFDRENIRLVNDLLEYTDNESIEGIMLSLDFRKAFDSVNRDFMFETLKSFNFWIIM